MSTSQTFPLHLKGIKQGIYVKSDERPDFASRFVRKMDTDALRENIAWISTLAPAAPIIERGDIPLQTIYSPFDKDFDTNLYASGVSYTKRQQRTDQTPNRELSRITGLLRDSYYRAYQQLAADIINNRTDGTNYAGIDGVALASASHPTDSGTYTNITTAVTGMSIGTLERMCDDVKAHREWTASQAWIQPQSFNLIAGDGNSEMQLIRMLAGSEQPQTTDREQNVAKRRLNFEGRTNPFITGTVLAMVPLGNENPLFVMFGHEMDVREDTTTGTTQAGHVVKCVMEFEAVGGWLRPQGVQFGTGGA